MSKSKKKKKRKIQSASQSRWSFFFFISFLQRWWQQKSTVIRFFSLFTLGIVGFYIFYGSNFYANQFSMPVINIQGNIAAFILQAIGYTVEITDNAMIGVGETLSIMKGCDGMEPIGMFVIGVLLVPFPLRTKIYGLIFGIGALIILNILRLVGLFLIKSHLPEWFDILHVHGGYVLFLFITLTIWMIWARWAFHQQNLERHA